MDNSPVVSVITIFLNAENYLREAIASICAQTHNDWELLLIDDGSTDGSTEIARGYASQQSDRIHYFEHSGHQNRGMSVSRNLGIAHARGQFIAFLDSDDVWVAKKLEQQLGIFESHPKVGMVYGRTLIWHSWPGNALEQQRDYFFDLGVPADQLIQPPNLLYLLLQNKAQTPTTCNALFRKDVLMQMGGFEESFRGMYEDQVVFAKTHLHYPVYVSSECWAQYRQRPDSCSSATFDSQSYCLARLPFLTWLSLYLNEKGIHRKSPLNKAVQKEIWLCRHPGYFRVINHYRHRKEQIGVLLGRIRDKNEPLDCYR